jgi:glutamate dehydrogenase (NAD(P)+)
MSTLDTPATVFDDLGPERIFHYYDPSQRLRAVVVMDTTRFHITAGGVRMASDLTLDEMIRLARAMSYKFAMLELPCGGAKAGIWFDPALSGRAAAVQWFLEAIRPLTESRAYLPGADMGTSAHDFAALFPDFKTARNLGADEFEGMLLEDQVTGYGVVAAARAAADHLGWPSAATVAIEGFGKVGAGAAKYFARAGLRVVAVSTVAQTLHDHTGLRIDELLTLRAAHGDAALDHYAGGDRMPRTALFTLPVDILVPGARPDVIHLGNVAALRARLIVPAANIPYAAGVLPRLHSGGIIALPDFVTNAGGVLAGLVGLEGGTAADVFATVDDRIGTNVRRLLTRAAALGIAPYEAALRQANERLRPIAPQ